VWKGLGAVNLYFLLYYNNSGLVLISS